ncbi:MAG TPA: VOC family protein [Patescibacteria group bacterium]|nr:VOC family protein [Patescibacteria group bacterium]
MSDPVIHFEVPYKDAERVKKFYSEVFGWRMNQMGADMNNYITAGTTDSDERGQSKTVGAINGGFFPVGEMRDRTLITISVPDAAAAAKKVEEAGGKTIDKPMPIPGVGIYVSCVDSEGNPFSLIQSEM